METFTIQPNEIELTVTPQQTIVTAQTTENTVTVSPSVQDVTVEPQNVEITVAPNEVNLTLLTGANITNNYGSDTIGVIAAETLSGHRIVTVEGYYASKDVSTDKFKVLGITTGAVASGSEATVQISGYITEAGWNWMVGGPVFLSTNGHLTQTVPTDGFRLIVGKPKTATILFLEISEPITVA